MFGEYGKAAGAKLAELYSQLLCALQSVVTATREVEAGTTGTARTLAYQYGVPPVPGQRAQFAPRSMTALPWIAEGETAEQITLDVLDSAGRYGFSGYVANIGDEPLRLAWLSVDGGNSGLFTLPPSVTVQVPCIVRGVIIEPAEDSSAARYQVSLS